MWDRCGRVNSFSLDFFNLYRSLSLVPVLSRLMNSQEAAICSRLRDLRRQIGWTQTQFAHAFGTTRDQLASIEYGRNPLRYWLADHVCEKANICQQWLACGDDPKEGYVRLPPEIGLEIKATELFSSAWHRRIGHLVKKRVTESQALRQTIASDPNAPEKILENGLYYLKLIETQRVKPEFYGDFCNALMAQMSDFINSHDSPGQPPASSLAPKTNPKKVLTTISLKSKERGVKTEVQKLIELVKRKASKPGAKSQLARTLGVAPARISEWLSGEKEPGGEYTLQLLHWVEQQERQK